MINLHSIVALCVLLLSLFQFINNNNEFQKDDKIHTGESSINSQYTRHINTESLFKMTQI